MRPLPTLSCFRAVERGRLGVQAQQTSRGSRWRASTSSAGGRDAPGLHSAAQQLTTSTSGMTRCLADTDCPSCFRAVGLSRTNAIPAALGRVGIAWTRGSCFRTAAHARRRGMLQLPARKVCSVACLLLLRGLYSHLRSTRTSLCIDHRRKKNKAYKRAFIAIQPWLAEPLFLRPLQESNGWTCLHRRQHRARPSGAVLTSAHLPQKVGLARPNGSGSGRWAQILRKGLPR